MILLRLSLLNIIALLFALQLTTKSLASEGEFLSYIVNFSSNTVSVIDSTNNQILIDIEVGNQPYGIAYNKDSQKLYVTNNGGDTVSVIDLSTNTVVSSIPVGRKPTAILYNSTTNRVYVSNNEDNSVTIIDAISETVVKTIPVGRTTGGLAVDQTGSKLYVANWADSNISVIDTITETVTGTATSGWASWGVAVDPTGTRVYVANGEGTLSVIDATSNTRIASVQVGAWPWGVTLNSSASLAYVSNFNSDTVSVVDTLTNTVLKTVNVGSQPVAMALTPTGSHLYVVNHGSNNISIIDTTNHNVVNTIPVRYNPISFGNFIIAKQEEPLFTVDAGQNLLISSENLPTFTVNGQAISDIQQNLTYRWISDQATLQDWTTVAVTGECPLFLRNANLTIGTFNLRLEAVNDKGIVAFDDMILTIDNSSPNAVLEGGGTYEINSDIQLGGQVADFDGDELTYRWITGTTEVCAGIVQPSSGGTPLNLTDQCILNNLEIGTHTVLFEISDGINEIVQKSLILNIVDNTKPLLSPVSNHLILWPPNNSMIDVSIQANAIDNSGVPVTLSATITSNEPDEGLLSGGAPSDWIYPLIDQANGLIVTKLRAERLGNGDGREYTISITATDANGNSSNHPVKVIVPHNKIKFD